MKAGKPSQTASLVALLRALADRGHTSVPGFADPTAHAMLTGRWTHALQWLEPLVTRVPQAQRPQLFRYLDMIPLRTLAIDRALTTALERGNRQLVVLGAGFDGRAFRLPQLADTHVFEVDHPATQRLKRQRTRALTPTCRQHSFVPVDFQRDSLEGELQKAGHRADQQSVWLCEGVSQYLEDAPLRAMLEAAAAASAPGSHLLIEYHDADQPTSSRRVQRLMLRAWSEPHIGLRSVHAMRELVERAGFRVESDTGGGDWADTFHAAPASPLIKRQRLLVARR